MTRAFDDIIEAIGIALLIAAAILFAVMVIPSTRAELLSYVRSVRHEMKLAKFSPAKIQKTCAKLAESNDLYSECYMPIVEATLEKESITTKNLGPSIQLGRMTLKSEHVLFHADENRAAILGRRLKEVHLMLSGLYWARSLDPQASSADLDLSIRLKKEILVSYVQSSQGLREEIRAELKNLGRPGRDLIRRLNQYDRSFVGLARLELQGSVPAVRAVGSAPQRAVASQAVRPQYVPANAVR